MKSTEYQNYIDKQREQSFVSIYILTIDKPLILEYKVSRDKLIDLDN